MNIQAFPWILWHLWKSRNGLAFERKHYSLVSVLTKAKEEAHVWFEINASGSDEVQTSLVVPRDPAAWIKPPPSHLKWTREEAELRAINWAVCVVSTRQQKIIFESSCVLARDILIAPSEFSKMGHFTNDIHFHLSALQDWSFHHCEQKRNVIATSVTTDHRYHSYIVRGGPTWLLQRIENEALT
ncbi:hypothetical protein DY000_02023882 [Brassica cretica]|uniref:RNase H type-1 domain-containing protein n=1 Tax=Brassica cretica TaxID=69181 RepID=A0ABQ7E3N9_BRACR|nr:hypothetical protein DY000_02023882 [Brassica cretica]